MGVQVFRRAARIAQRVFRIAQEVGKEKRLITHKVKRPREMATKFSGCMAGA